VAQFEQERWLSLVRNNHINQFLFGYIKSHIEEENKEQIELNPKSINQDSLSINGIIKYISDPFLRQLVLTERIRRNLDKKNVSIFENYQDIITKTITEQFLIEPLREKYQKVKQQIEHPEIVSDAILLDLRNTDIAGILDSLIKVNLGKVIYIDCWGPWCGPCMKELPNSKQMMNELKDKDIVFVYFCIDSDLPKWKATIGDLELGGIHYFFDKDQSTSLRKNLEITGVPYYLLINKKGIIKDKGTHLTPSTPETLTEIERLLDEGK
jgi:thiol-disulfide isomerase/thioredoxin